MVQKVRVESEKKSDSDKEFEDDDDLDGEEIEDSCVMKKVKDSAGEKDKERALSTMDKPNPVKHEVAMANSIKTLEKLKSRFAAFAEVMVEQSLLD